MFSHRNKLSLIYIYIARYSILNSKYEMEGSNLETISLRNQQLFPYSQNNKKPLIYEILITENQQQK